MSTTSDPTTDSNLGASLPADLQISGLTTDQQSYAFDLIGRHGFESFTEATSVLHFTRGGDEPTATQVFQQLINADRRAKNESTRQNRADNLTSVQMSVQASQLQGRTDRQRDTLMNAIAVMEEFDAESFFDGEPELLVAFRQVLSRAKMVPMKATNRHEWTMALGPIIDTCTMLGLDINGYNDSDEIADHIAQDLAGVPDGSDGFTS